MGRGSRRTLAVVAVSGGLDSCVTAAVAAREHRLALLHASYGQRTAGRERRAFDAIADFYRVPPERRLVADLSYLARIGGSSLTDRRIEVPATGQIARTLRSASQSRGGGIPNTYVPFRNTHILSVAVSWAEVTGAAAVYLGAVEQDSSGYPDCREAYFAAFQTLVDAGTRPETHIRVCTPLIGMNKSEIVRKGIELGAPLHLTWSCYQSETAACGRCESCLLRLRGFREAGVPDPIPYAD